MHAYSLTPSARLSLGLTLVVCFFAHTRAHGDSVALNPVKDNTIYSEANNLSNGVGSYIFAGKTNGGNVRRALIAFNVAGAVPAGSTINSVTLDLYMSRTQAGNQTVSLHRISADWGEGTSNADQQEGNGTNATDNDATWAYRFFVVSNPPSSPAWTNAGGDYAGTSSASTTVGGSGSYTWTSTSALVSDVQGWLNSPSGNFGWIVIGNEGPNQTTKRFESRTASQSSRRPRLNINFTPPVINGACCLGDGSCQVLTQSNCTSQSGTYQGNGTTCTPNPCMQPTGACCFADGSCQVLTSAACAAAIGTYQGNGTNCTPNLCPQPTGACCLNSGVCIVVTVADCATQGGTYQGDNSVCMVDLCPIILTPFVDALPIPPLATPTIGTPGGAATYDMDIVQVQQALHQDLPPTTLWTYEGMFPGPTILATRDVPITVNWINDLRDEQGNLRTTHYLPVELCIHGAENVAKVVTHLHGGHVPAAYDGYPYDTILPGQSVSYEYPNHQLPSLIWYHDHALGVTRLNVYMGLAGGYVITDAYEQSLNLPTGEFDVPLVIQDRSFHPDGSLKYPAVHEEHFFGDKMLVNGKVWPYLNVKQGKYRLRTLDGCNSRTLRLAFSNGQTFYQIGTDGGLLAAPVSLSEVTLGPGERVDLIVDFAGFPAGTEILLLNSAPAPFPSGDPMHDLPNVMKFVVTAQSGDTDPLPPALRPLDVLNSNDAAVARDFVLRKMPDACAGSMWMINDLPYDTITEYPHLGTIEIWNFINRSGVSHPMHLHLVMFQIVNRQNYEIVNDEVVPIGDPIPPEANEVGWKDTVMSHPNQITRVITRFENYTGRYSYHCHILEHEEHEMMRQFETQCVKGDTNQDTVVDGNDIALFVQAMTVGATAGTAQYCATDMDNNLILETAFDIDLFVDCLLGNFCP
ncbi:MAG: multicopper oxidase domain-containing protein [Planctomycetota bacterium]